MRSVTDKLKRSRKRNNLGSAELAIKTSLKFTAVVISISQLALLTTTKKFMVAIQIVMLARNAFLIAQSRRNRLRIERRRRCVAGSLVTVNVQPTTQE